MKTEKIINKRNEKENALSILCQAMYTESLRLENDLSVQERGAIEDFLLEGFRAICEMRDTGQNADADLRDVETRVLVEELKKRTEVKARYAEPRKISEYRVSGSAQILIVFD